MQKKPYKISFVVASVNRNEQLQKCISSIEKAHEHSPNIPVEILIVIQKAKQKIDINLRFPEITTVYYIDKIGLSVARNFAINKSLGDYLVFLDDDAGVNIDFIEVLTKETSKYDKINAFCGRLIDPSQSIPFSHLFYNDNVKKLRRLDFQYFMGSAHVLSRMVLNKVGEYNERFGVGSQYYNGGEETELFVRLKAANEEVLYLPDLIFFHPVFLPSFSYAQNYGHASAAMMMQNCLNDKTHFYVYMFVILKLILKLSIRLMQKQILKGKYHELDKKYNYGGWLLGTYKGIKDFVKNEIFLKKKAYDQRNKEKSIKHSL